jgi:hypothetical protein
MIDQIYLRDSPFAPILRVNFFAAGLGLILTRSDGETELHVEI